MVIKSHYIPALDGLRAFAVLAVVAYHMDLPFAGGGLMGVNVFFVLSGYLITSLLLIEHSNTGSIDLPQFWLRRIRRLFPAIVFAVLGTLVLATLFNHVLLTKMKADILPSLFFFNNWWQIFHDVSYFDALGSPSPLTHYWSLAIEEQFYLIWPPLLLLAFKAGARRKTVRNITVGLAVLSAVLMAVLYSPEIDPSRVYYGTDCRAFALLIGCVLAFVWPSHRLGARAGADLSTGERGVFDGIGAAAFVGLLALVAFTDGASSFPYRGGLVLCSILTALLIAVLVHPISFVGRIFSLAPFVWIGKRSYSMYLWHYPLILIMSPANGEPTPMWLMLLQLAVMTAMSAVSYTFIENPIRHGALGDFFRRLASHTVTIAEWARTHLGYAVVSAAMVLIGAFGLAFVQPESALGDADYILEGSATAGVEDSAIALMTSILTEASNAAEASKPTYSPLIIADSVGLRAAPFTTEIFPTGVLDAKVNRQFLEGAQLYSDYAKIGHVEGDVVFALGTNGPPTEEQVEELIDTVGDGVNIWFVNVRAPVAWESTVNTLLQQAAERHDNVRVIDWNSFSADHSDWFDGDGTHLTLDAARIYMTFIHDAIGYEAPADTGSQAPASDDAQASSGADASTSSDEA